MRKMAEGRPAVPLTPGVEADILRYTDQAPGHPPGRTYTNGGKDMKRILCFGDSNTWGFNGAQGGLRFPEEVRWTGRLSRLMGEDVRIIEEGMNGRTLSSFDDMRPGAEAMEYLLPCLASHLPLDAVVFMLGTNECKPRFGRTAAEITADMGGLVDRAIAYLARGLHGQRPDPVILLVAPKPLAERAAEDAAFDMGSVEMSRQLAEGYRALAEERGLLFLDAGTAAEELGPDGCHLSENGHHTLAEAVAALLGPALERQG